MERASESTIDSVECWKAVRERCQRLGLTQIELARRVGVDLSTLNWFENGRQHIKPSTLAKVEEALAAAEAGTRATEVLRAQTNLAHGSARPSNSLIPPPEGTPERAEWDEDFRLRLLYSDRPCVRMQFARLRRENARLSKHIKVLEKMNALVQQQPITTSEDGRVATTTDSEETVAAVQLEMEAEHAEKTDYLGRNSAKKRIDRQVRERKEARSEAEALRAQLGDETGRGPATVHQNNQQQAQPQQPPTPEQYEGMRNMSLS